MSIGCFDFYGDGLLRTRTSWVKNVICKEGNRFVGSPLRSIDGFSISLP